MIAFEQEVGRVQGETEETQETKELEIVLSTGVLEGKLPSKRFLVNKVPKRRIDFAGNLPSVLFSPEDLDLLTGSPGARRRFLDEVLEQVDRDYLVATTQYSKAIRQRNALLERVQETGVRHEKLFEYWDSLLIKNGQLITKKREEFIEYVNNSQKDIFELTAVYDKSTISKERLGKYKEAENGAGVTLVGPHRDDVLFFMNKEKNIKMFGSRGQKRLVVLQLKMFELVYIQKSLGVQPMLLLDDIFSELDAGHINLVMNMIGNQQTIITTTHEEFVGRKTLKDLNIIELKLKENN